MLNFNFCLNFFFPLRFVAIPKIFFHESGFKAVPFEDCSLHSFDFDFLIVHSMTNLMHCRLVYLKVNKRHYRVQSFDPHVIDDLFQIFSKSC